MTEYELLVSVKLMVYISAKASKIIRPFPHPKKGRSIAEGFQSLHYPLDESYDERIVSHTCTICILKGMFIKFSKYNPRLYGT